MKFRSVLALFALLCASTVDAQKKMVCYWFAEIEVGHIDPTICTHIVYSFLGLDSNGGLTYLDRSQGQAEGYLRELVGLKSQNPNVQILAAVGGYNEPLVPVWSAMAANAGSRDNFARNVLSFLQRNNLNGIDIDWEYPNFDGNAPHDVQNFNLLLQDLQRVLGSGYSVSTAIGVGPWRTGLSYDIPAVFQHNDFVNVMTYDLHGGWESQTGIHAALFAGPNDPGTANVDYSIQLLLNMGVPRSKLIMGMASYGNAFSLSNPSNNGVGAPASGAGSLKYHQICQRINSGQFSYRWEEAQRSPYAFGGSDWVGYDDVRSITEKSNYINQHNLGGGMWWAIDNDDYQNGCGAGRYPLITTSHRIVIGGETGPAPTSPPSPPNTTNPPGGGGGGSFTCPGDGLWKHPSDCTKFYNCHGGVGVETQCPPGTHFNERIGACDWPESAGC